jgi:hypothetical protein
MMNGVIQVSYAGLCAVEEGKKKLISDFIGKGKVKSVKWRGVEDLLKFMTVIEVDHPDFRYEDAQYVLCFGQEQGESVYVCGLRAEVKSGESYEYKV